MSLKKIKNVLSTVIDWNWLIYIVQNINARTAKVLHKHLKNLNSVYSAKYLIFSQCLLTPGHSGRSVSRFNSQKQSNSSSGRFIQWDTDNSSLRSENVKELQFCSIAWKSSLKPLRSGRREHIHVKWFYWYVCRTHKPVKHTNAKRSNRRNKSFLFFTGRSMKVWTFDSGTYSHKTYVLYISVDF